MNDSFKRIFASVPLGTIISFSDGAPRPPERFKRKLREWERNNGTGRLTAKKTSGGRGEWDRDTITIHLGDYGGGGLITLRSFMSFDAASSKTFEVREYIAAGRYVLLTHSVHVGTEYQGDFTRIEDARQRQYDGHRYSDCGIYRTCADGALEFVEGVDGPREAVTA